MAGHLLSAFLAALALALTAAGFVIEEYAVWLWVAAGVLGIAFVASVVWEWRRKVSPLASKSRACTRGDQSPAINIPGNQNTVTIGAPAPVGRPADPRVELRAAHSDVRSAISAFEDKAAFDHDPLRFQIHVFGDSTKAVRRLVSEHWPTHDAAVDAALAYIPQLSEYEWRRKALRRLDKVVEAVLNGPSRLLDRLIDRRLTEGDELRDRLSMKVTAMHVAKLFDDMRRWQERCVRCVARCAPNRAASFKSKAGAYQLPYAEALLKAKQSWQSEVGLSLERWMDALRGMHS